jgi:hypothetical protein
MSIIEQCDAAFEGMFPNRLSAIEKECAIDTVLVEFAQWAQSPEMVERIASQYFPNVHAHGRYEARKWITEVLDALFREAGVSGGGG